jgi:hypothetical protein
VRNLLSIAKKLREIKSVDAELDGVQQSELSMMDSFKNTSQALSLAELQEFQIEDDCEQAAAELNHLVGAKRHALIQDQKLRF